MIKAILTKGMLYYCKVTCNNQESELIQNPTLKKIKPDK